MARLVTPRMDRTYKARSFLRREAEGPRARDASVMGYVMSIFRAWSDTGLTGTSDRTDETIVRRTDTVQCRDCGRWYTPGRTTCPHCDSSNQLRQGPFVWFDGSLDVEECGMLSLGVLKSIHESGDLVCPMFDHELVLRTAVGTLASMALMLLFFDRMVRLYDSKTE